MARCVDSFRLAYIALAVLIRIHRAAYGAVPVCLVAVLRAARVFSCCFSQGMPVVVVAADVSLHLLCSCVLDPVLSFRIASADRRKLLVESAVKRAVFECAVVVHSGETASFIVRRYHCDRSGSVVCLNCGIDQASCKSACLRLPSVDRAVHVSFSHAMRDLRAFAQADEAAGIPVTCFNFDVCKAVIELTLE